MIKTTNYKLGLASERFPKSAHETIGLLYLILSSIAQSYCSDKQHHEPEARHALKKLRLLDCRRYGIGNINVRCPALHTYCNRFSFLAIIIWRIRGRYACKSSPTGMEQKLVGCVSGSTQKLSHTKAHYR